LFFQGSGKSMPNGMLSSGLIQSIASKAPGAFGWQDLVRLYTSLPVQFQANSRYFLARDFFGSMLTETSATGQPIWTPQVIQSGGLPSIMGRPVTLVDQMPHFLDKNGQPVTGATPAAIGDWKKTYMVVNRRGLTVFRDPFSMQNCGVRWRFSQRLGGDVLCSAAALFLKIQ
jgi:HK97 family phage major capsid protein